MGPINAFDSDYTRCSEADALLLGECGGDGGGYQSDYYIYLCLPPNTFAHNL